MPMTTTPKGDQPPPDRGGQLRAPVDDENTPGREGSSEHELPPEILNKRICDFDLRIEGGPLENVIERFRRELAERGITKLQPAFYLSDEWGVSDGTVAIAIPFYLADERLRRVQQARSGVVEGKDDEDILRYLRHEMGHVVNYAYQLYEDARLDRLVRSDVAALHRRVPKRPLQPGLRAPPARKLRPEAPG